MMHLNPLPKLTPEQIAAFHRDGFLSVGPVLTSDETDALHEALIRVLSGKSDAAPEALHNMGKNALETVIQIVNIWQSEPAFCAHLYQPKIVPLVAQLMNTNTVRVWHDQVQIKPSHIGGPTLWHQDHPYWPVIGPADLVSAWVALDEATIENGAMSMVPGSYKWGPYNGGTIGTNPQTWGPDPDYARLPPEARTVLPVPVPVPKGGIVFHHCLTWHGAPPNRTNRGRPAIAVHYMPEWTRYTPDTASHLVEKHITVASGEILTGDAFPTVMENGEMKAVASLPYLK